MLNNPEVTSATSEISLNHRKGNKNFPSCTTFSTENTTFLTKFYPPPQNGYICIYAYSVRRCSHKKRGWLIKKLCEYQNALKNLQMVCLPATIVPNFVGIFLPIIKDVCTQKNHQKTGIKNRDFTTRYKKYAKKCNYLYISIYKRPNQKSNTASIRYWFQPYFNIYTSEAGIAHFSIYLTFFSPKWYI